MCEQLLTRDARTRGSPNECDHVISQRTHAQPPSERASQPKEMENVQLELIGRWTRLNLRIKCETGHVTIKMKWMAWMY